tara:strand:+ start:286 stop:606 length:321 start_codon:yes stop_codon:yes gene_type:complete
MEEPNPLQLYEQLEKLTEHQQELARAGKALLELKEEKTLITPIGAGIFIPTKTKTEDIIVGVGCDIAVEKPAEEVLHHVEDQLQHLTVLKNEMEHHLEKMIESMEK